MIFIAGAGRPRKVDLGVPVLVELRKDEDTPVDSLSAAFPLSGLAEEYRTLTVYQGETAIFDGIVDEQRVMADASGRMLRLECRSRAALLLDNEALPQQYVRPSLPLLFGRHAAPYGFTRIRGDSSVFSETFSVAKGMSEWAALSEFCETFLGISPRVTNLGELDVTGTPPKGVLFFSLTGGIPFCTLEEAFLPCELLSEVWVRADSQGGYNIRVADERALALGIRRRRYCNASPSTARPASHGEAVVRKARGKSYRLILSCPGWVDAQMGQAARVEDPLLGEIRELLVCSLRYRLGREGRTTNVTLRKREE